MFDGQIEPNYMYAEYGYQIIKRFLSPKELHALRNAVSELNSDGRSGGFRNIETKSEPIHQLTESTKVKCRVGSYIKNDFKLVRAIYFNKTPEQNWLVSWHQDKTVAVSRKFKNEHWHNWSSKNGVVHAQPAKDVFNTMVTLRLHLDATDFENGGLKCIPGSHKLGVLDQQDILNHVDEGHQVLCKLEAGDAMVIHPLLIHASSKASKPSTRRIIHLEFSSYSLPDNVEWV